MQRGADLKRTIEDAKVLIWSRTTSIPRSSDAFSYELIPASAKQLRVEWTPTDLEHVLLVVCAVDTPRDCQDRTGLPRSRRTIEEQMRQSSLVDELLNCPNESGVGRSASFSAVGHVGRRTCSRDGLVRYDVVEGNRPVLLDPAKLK